nr:immunoglobulin light chain junction region [Macaca mulatta]
CQQGHSNPPTF